MMNSTTGVGAAIGAKTGKIVCYGTRNKRCATCEVALRLKRPPRPHDCRRNHHGSSKSMEPSVAVEIAKKIENQGAHVACLVGDDDSSTLKRLRDEVGDITKQSDTGYFKRSLESNLMKLKHKKL